MQMLLFAVGEGVRDRVLASDNISLNENLAKYREGVKAGRVRKKPESELGTERKKTDNGSRKKPGCRTALCY